MSVANAVANRRFGLPFSLPHVLSQEHGFACFREGGQAAKSVKHILVLRSLISDAWKKGMETVVSLIECDSHAIAVGRSALLSIMSCAMA